MHHKMPRPTNLKVLPKNITGKQLMTIMHGFKGALGVECSFCHAGNPATHHMNFASDEKPEKNIARTMLRMTHEINMKYLSTVHVSDAAANQKMVTCGTCHRGHAIPVAFVVKEEHMDWHPHGPHKP
ncbi:MAG TPA: c-type cytochrome [Acidobacteriaceae bacterium]|nr:c-type cytochrome [Acidobacteriaceae bacterium]